MNAPAAAAASPENQSQADCPEVFLTISEVAALLDVSEKTVRRRVKAGVIRKAQLEGRAVRIPPFEIARLSGIEITPGCDQGNSNNTKDFDQCSVSIP